ncbi:APC family permease [Paraburkholderia caribensis]|uniref:APC family permease n=1 Tax=Paraburkholderia caribensis TaxID=75105 RepID=A0A9Q6S7J7_9BURK|nr:APC family permease [Paraburkholderia caribensis]MCO4878269.1 APC family permease [Paraburkholderia caribensis]PTB28629.1 APC family permease [Paraburkholderia caribensis]QLB66069.1 amino acid permease [Paraburkholderia caribensis]
METLTNNADGSAGSPEIRRASEASRPATLSGHLGTFDIVFTVLAYNAPLTVVTGFIGLLMSLGNGLGAPVTFLCAGSLMLLFAVGFTTMSKHVPNAGAFYAYITAGLGRPLGFGSALMAMLAYGFMMIGMYLYAGVVYSSLIKHLFNSTPLIWWGYSLILLAVVAVFGYLRITFSAKVLTLALVCEVVLVFVWEIAVAAAKGPVGLNPVWLTPGAVMSGSVGLGLLFGVTSFAGFEATAVFREEARQPDVTIPRATYAAVILLALLFASASFFLICGYGPKDAMTRATADASTIALDSIGLYLGHAGMETVNVLLCSSVFACLLALHNILSRYIYCLGIDGTLPRSWAAVHKRHGSPHRASVMVSVVMLAIVIAVIRSGVEPYAGYGVVTGVGGYALLLLLVMTSLSVMVFFMRKSTNASVWKTRVAPFVSFVLLSVIGWLATVNMEILTGNVKVATDLLVFIFGTLIAGCFYAARLKKTKPDVYAAIGRQKI